MMAAHKKVWVMIYKKTANGELLYLALKPTPGPEYPYEYYVVTGSLEGDESFEQAAVREAKEETGLEVDYLLDLNYVFNYKQDKQAVREQCYGALVQDGEIVLNEEHVGYKWMDKNEFVAKLWWLQDREILKKLLEKTTNL